MVLEVVVQQRHLGLGVREYMAFLASLHAHKQWVMAGVSHGRKGTAQDHIVDSETGNGTGQHHILYLVPSRPSVFCLVSLLISQHLRYDPVLPP